MRVTYMHHLISSMREAVKDFNDPPAPSGCTLIMNALLCYRVSYDDTTGIAHRRYFLAFFTMADVRIRAGNARDYQGCVDDDKRTSQNEVSGNDYKKMVREAFYRG